MFPYLSKTFLHDSYSVRVLPSEESNSAVWQYIQSDSSIGPPSGSARNWTENWIHQPWRWEWKIHRLLWYSDTNVGMARTVAASALTGQKDRNDMWKSSLQQTKKKVTDNDDSWCAPTPFLFNFVDLVVLSLLLLLLSSQVLLALFCAFRCLGCAFSSILTGLFFSSFPFLIKLRSSDYSRVHF